MRPTSFILPVALLAGIAAVCLLLSAGPRRYESTADRLQFDGKAINAGWHSVERTDAFGAPMRYRWTNGSALVVLPNPGGALSLRLELAAGIGRRTNVTLATDRQRLSMTVSSSPRTYHILLAPEPDELITLRIDSPGFAESGGTRQLGVILAGVGVIGGGSPLRVVLISALLAGLALYLILQRPLRPIFAAGLALAVQTLALAWQDGPGWLQGIFAALQAVGVVGATLALLIVELARPDAMHPRSITPSGRLVIVGRVLLPVLFLIAAIWTQIVVIPGLASDLGIYLQAAARALSGIDPYQPFLIGVSYVYPPPALALFSPLSALDFPDAQLSWRILGALATIGSALALRRAFVIAVPVPLGATWLLALAASFAPLWESLSIGQVNSLVLLGISLFILGHRDQRWAWAGDLGLAVAIMLKISPLLLLALPLLRADWRRGLRVGAGLAGLSLLALPWFGPQRWADFLAIAPLLLQGNNANPYNIALAALGSRFSPTTALIGRALAGALPTLWLLLCIRDRRGDPRPILVLGVLAMTLGSSLIWYHHLIFLAVPVVWLLIGTTSVGPALAGLLALALVQISRPAEFGLGLGPWLAVAGYLLFLGATVTGMRRAAQPDPL